MKNNLEKIQSNHEMNQVKGGVVAAEANRNEAVLASQGVLVGAGTLIQPSNILYPKLRQLKVARAKLANERHYLQQQSALVK